MDTSWRGWRQSARTMATPSTPSELRAQILKGSAFVSPAPSSSSCGRRAIACAAASSPSAPTAVPALAAAAQVASGWQRAQEERAAMCADWDERTAPPHTPAGQRLNAVLSVVESGIDRGEEEDLRNSNPTRYGLFGKAMQKNLALSHTTIDGFLDTRMGHLCNLSLVPSHVSCPNA